MAKTEGSNSLSKGNAVSEISSLKSSTAILLAELHNSDLKRETECSENVLAFSKVEFTFQLCVSLLCVITVVYCCLFLCKSCLPPVLKLFPILGWRPPGDILIASKG